MNSTFEIAGIAVEHRVNRRMKHCYITIDKKGKVVLKTPGLSKRACMELLERKAGWIARKVAERPTVPVVELGKEALYLGELHSLHDAAALPELYVALQRLRSDAPERLGACYDRFYADEAKDYLPRRVAHFSAIMGVKPLLLRYRKMKRRWGSCSSHGVITFNTYLMQAAPELIDYVVVHELAHLKHMNHSAAFHGFVRRFLPDEKERRKRLRGLEVEPYTL